MGKIAFVFAGQGAQHVGMGKSLYDAYPSVRQLFLQAEERRPGTLELMFQGEESALKQTENTQPCLYLADLAAALALGESGIHADAAAGFSLGEIPALAFAGAYSHGDGFTLASVRGAAMGRAARSADTGMAAVLKLDNETVEALTSRFDGVYPVNYNCPGQLVISAHTEQMAPFAEAVKEAGGRILPLNVSGGFHSPFMAQAAAEFADFLRDFPLTRPPLPVYSNYTAEPYTDDVRALLAAQIENPVRWEKIIRTMAEAGFDTFIECGPGTTLTKLIGKILPEAKVFSAETAEQIAAVAGGLL